MTKQEFLEKLRRYLSGSLDYRQVNDHLRYYTEYIDGQLEMGKTEEEVMAELGDPRLIAKTLTEMEGTETADGGYREEFIEDEESAAQKGFGFHFNGKVLRIPRWVFGLGIGLLSFFVLTLFFTLITWFLPYLFVIIGGIMIYRFFRKNF